MKRIIVADDEELIRNMYARFINRLGRTKGIEVEVELVDSGERLVEKVLAGNYGLIISDYDMKNGMNGVEALREIRGSGNKTPFIIVSSSDVKDEAMKEGATGYLEKPYDLNVFKEIINNYLEERENE